MKRLSLLFVLFLSVAACDSGDPSAEDVAGTYVASSFTVDGDDVLSAGIALQMTLDADGRVSGQFTVPAEFTEFGEEVETYSLDGTYVLSGDRVRFSQDADTFIRDATWTYDDGELRATDDEISVVLRRR